MTKDDFLCGLKACGCMYHQDKKYYEHNELVKCFEDLGLLDRDSSDEKQTQSVAN